MKKIIAVILCIGAILMLVTGCGDNEQTPGNENTPGVSDIGTFSEADIALIIGGETFRCGEDVTELLEKMGDDYTYSEAISCAYDGLDKNFAYADYDIYTYPDGNIDRVSEITVYNADASTPKGLKVGDTVEVMEQLYGSGYKEEGITLVYVIEPKQENAQGASLYVVAEDGIIQSISITAEILVE
ncbi:MAG: hypothetical protein ACOX1Q_05670 [Eubacteriales bacterium]|jgi:hypothetical protein